VGARRMQLGRSAFGRYRQLKLLVSRHPGGADATKCGLDVLALHRRDHVRGRRIVGGQSVGIEPQPQRIIERPASL
jgi:hypothetical protein